MKKPRAAKINIVVAGTEEGIVMVESGAQQATEAEVLAAIEFGHDCCKKIAAADPRAGRQGGQEESRVTLRRPSTRRSTIRSPSPSPSS